MVSLFSLHSVCRWSTIEYEYVTHDSRTIIPLTSHPMLSHYTEYAIPAPYSGDISGEMNQ